MENSVKIMKEKEELEHVYANVVNTIFQNIVEKNEKNKG
jgi:hypothetical protein